MHRLARSLLRIAVAFATLATTAHAVQGLGSSCWAMRADDGSLPSCCAKSLDDRVESLRDCCGTASVADAASAGTSESLRAVPSAIASFALTTAEDAVLRRWTSTRGFRPVIERPPDRSPPTQAIVLLI